ncbi:MAG: phosphatidate cytidylyltransferase [Rhodospirillaceae bacterium]|nr:phosphatidate cytidylyltransferase [Rhodospirillaceae bacterium]
MVAELVDGARRELRLRILSALVMAPVALAAVFLGGIAFKILVAVAALAMAWEWDRLWDRAGQRSAPRALLLGTTLAAVFLAAEGFAGWGIATALAGAASLCLFGVRLGRGSHWWGVGLAYVALPCIAFIWLRQVDAFGGRLIIWLLLVVWASDVGGYLFGRMIGGPKLAPRISPKKTWAGLAGAVALGTGVGAATALGMDATDVMSAALVAIFVALGAQGGDLAESALKRSRGVKDTSGLIPGHGGILDRVDGLLAGASLLAVLSLFGGESVLGWR